MHSVEELGTNVPAFLAKLWKMVEDSETNDLICWSPSGTSFYIRDQARFARELLPLYYKHNNMASFVRQLNMYGFHKVVSIESGGLKIDRDDMEFAHQFFVLGHPYLLEHIKRKIPSNKSDDGRSGTKPEIVNKVLSEVKSLKGRQDNVDTQLSAMKRENEVLWREVAILRQKHHKQQQIVNKLIQFLVSMVQTSRGGGIGIKRHYPLMINDITHRANKNASKINGNIDEVNTEPCNSSPTGPVIHELDPTELLDDCSPALDDETSAPVFDLVDAVNARISPTADAGAASASTVLSNNATSANVSIINGSDLDDQTTDVLFELAEECPLSSDEMIISDNSSTLLTSSKTNKGKQKSTTVKGSKKRKTKLMTISKAATPLITIKKERTDPEEAVNVNSFLEIVLPSLVNDARNPEKLEETNESQTIDREMILGDLCDESLEMNGKEQGDSLEAATDAAISAISDVAAQAAAAATPTTTGISTATITTTSTSPVPKPNSDDITTDVSLHTNLVEDKLISDTPEVQESDSGRRDMTLACAASGDMYKCKEDFDAHVDSMQSELDSLKELLKGEGCNLDANMLLGVCGAGLGFDANTVKLFGDDSLTFGIPLAQDEYSGKNEQNGISDPLVSGSELMTYSSNLLDLTDMSELDDDTWGSPTNNFNEESNDVLNTPLMTISSPGFSGAASKKRKISK